MNLPRLILIAIGIAFFIAPSPAKAACNALAGCSCTVTATNVSFGNYNPLDGANNDATGSVRVRCILLVALVGSFTIDLSTGDSGSYTTRRMRNGANALTYNLYTTAARTQVWGNGTGSSVQVTRNFLALLSVDDTTTVYARIPAGQNVPAGAYGDTIVVTVTY